MKIGVSIVHYPHRSQCENVVYFAERGFTSIEFYGPHFYEEISDVEKAKKLAETIQKYDVTVTVHHAIPQPTDEKACEEYYRSLNTIKLWQEKYGLLYLLSFDVWVLDRSSAKDLMQYAIDTFLGTGTKIAFEDYPLNAVELMQTGLKYTTESGILMDLGHTNVRLCRTKEGGKYFLENGFENAPLLPGDNSVEAFRNAFLKKPLPVFELHLHNNNGIDDEHHCLEDGTADFCAIAKMLKEVGFKGVANIEINPLTSDVSPGEADKITIAELEKWKKWICE